MISQIYTYFSIEMIYLWLNIGVLPFWFILVFFPYSRVCKIFTISIFPLIIFSLVYGFLIYKIFLSSYNFLNNFNLYLSFENLQSLFEEKYFLILFWIHFLAINLFIGSWVSRDAIKYSIPKKIVVFPLALIYFAGPLGLVVYWFFRIFYSKKLGWHD